MAQNGLKNVLINEGITQAELTKESGISQGTINKVCNGKRTPSPTTQHKILKALNKLTHTKYELSDIF